MSSPLAGIDPFAMRPPDPLLLGQMLSVLDSDDARFADYQKAWEAYNGELPKPLKSNVPPDSQQAGQHSAGPDLNVRVNRIRPLVQAGVHFLVGTPPTILLDGATVADVPSAPDDARWLARCFAWNHWRIWLQNLAINGEVCGHMYARTDPPRPGQPYPNLAALNPGEMTLRWDPRDISTITGFVWRYGGLAADTKRPLTVQQRIVGDETLQHWTIIDEHQEAGDWTIDHEAEWKFSWPPISQAQNLPAPNSVYGQAGVTPTMIEAQRARNLVLSLGIKTYYNHGSPIVWLKNVAQKAFVALNRILPLGKDGEAGQLQPAADVAPMVALGHELDDSIFEEGQTPGMAVGRGENLGNLSGVALRVRMWPLLSKTEARRALLEPLLIEVCQHLLELGGKGPTRTITVQWPELLPSDPLAERDVAIIDRQLGASAETLLTRLGLDPATERTRRQAEANDPTLGASDPKLADLLARRADTRTAPGKD